MKRKSLTADHLHFLGLYGLSNIEQSLLSLLTFERGEYICMEGDPFEHLLLVTEGIAQVSVLSSTGKALLLCSYIGSGVIGELELMLGEDFTTTIQATSYMVCIGIPITHYRDALLRSVPFLNYVGRSLAQKLDRVTSNNAINILYPLKTRLCAYIILKNVDGVFKENLVEVANVIGTSYRHLFRVLGQLCEEKILQNVDNGHNIVDFMALEKLAENHYQKFE
ncbi:MAG: cyclic nucleotide-binding domain-containing protein [Chloroflexi bacterium]|nr:cyclic nucleotide-binding domain-containing protein [Chloroflexota bacterium]